MKCRIGDRVQWVKFRKVGKSMEFTQRTGTVKKAGRIYSTVRDDVSRRGVIVRNESLRDINETGQLTEAVMTA